MRANVIGWSSRDALWVLGSRGPSRPRCAPRFVRGCRAPVPRTARRRSRRAARSTASSAAVRTDSPRRRGAARARRGCRHRSGRSGSRRTCRRRRRAGRRKPRRAPRVGDAAVRDDELRVRIGLDEAGEVVGDGRQAAAAVDQDGDSPLGREGEHGCEALVVQEELLRTRVELDAAGAEVEAADRFLDRLLGQVEADERNEGPPSARLRPASGRWRPGSRGGGRARPCRRRTPAGSVALEERTRSSNGAVNPSMSRPTWTWASKRRGPSGMRASASSSYAAMRERAWASVSSTILSLAQSG